MATESTEARELSLVGKVELRIALASTDAALSNALGTYLAPLLLKLASEHQSVRNKVISICQHISTRVKPVSVQLPVSALVKQFKDQESNLIRHFDVLYIHLGVSRLTNAERAQLLPLTIKGISASSSHAPAIFNLLLKLLESFALPLRGSKEDGQLRDEFGVSPADAAFLSTYIGKLILFVPQKARPEGSPAPRCPGLSLEDYGFLTLQSKDDTWNPAMGGLNLLRTKILAARLLASGLFVDSERFLPAVFASADASSPISDIGEDILKRAIVATDLEDETLIKTIYDLYFGTGKIARVRPALRLKFLTLLSKSLKSTTYANRIMDLVEDGITAPSIEGDDTVMSNGPISIGREASKLRTAVFSYINYAVRQGSKETLETIAVRLIGRLRDFVENQGWPIVGQHEDLTSRGYAYEVIGLLARVGLQQILSDDDQPQLDLLTWLFESLARDNSGNAIIVSVEEALSTLLSAYAALPLSEKQQDGLADMLAKQMELSTSLEQNKRLRSTRYVALRFANRCLPFESAKARWIDVLGMGATNDRGEVLEEAERGLSPYWYRMNKGMSTADSKDDVKFPSFDSVMAQFFGRGRTVDDEVEPAALARQTYSEHRSSIVHMNAFARRLLFHEAIQKTGSSVAIDAEWERKLDTKISNDPTTRHAVKALSQTSDTKASQKLSVLLCAHMEAMLMNPNNTDDSLINLLAASPDDLVRQLVRYVDRLSKTLQSNLDDRRVVVAHAFGIIASHPATDLERLHAIVDVLLDTVSSWKTAVGSAANNVHGALVALAHYFSRASYRGSLQQASNRMQVLLATVLQILQDSRDSMLLDGAYISLGQLSMFLTITTADIGKHADVRTIIDRLSTAAKSGNENAIICIGQLSMILEEGPSDSHLAYVQEKLNALHEIRQAELHFTVGEAMSYVAVGWQSEALASKMDIDSALPTLPTRTSALTTLLDRILLDCANTKPSLKKASAMWLLCLVQFCGSLPALQERLPQCQAAFKRCLADRDDLVQETGSRGLGLVYERGSRSLKDDLVRDLLSSFSSDRQTQLAGNVSADTQLFEPGALPTGDGSVSTYKDIMSLAAEVGDSTLVYQFMSMASSNAVWSTRAAFGRFGLSNVLSDSSVDGYLANNPKLYPKLFRYRFDPNGAVQASMNEIWKALVKDSSATIDKHFDAIMQDLLVSVLGREWRVRQASCAAIADLVSGRPAEKYQKYLEQIWTQCFKVLDDIKESVRSAAAKLARTLTGVLTRTLEADHTANKSASMMLKHVLPFLLSSQGLESSAKEVQMFAVHTLLEIIKKASGSTLRPFIPELVERLIGLLSSLEPEAVNYVHMNAAKYNLTEQKIDDMRLSSVQTSPLMQAIERCLDVTDEATMEQLQPRLENAMKSAVGLPSKVGASRVLVSLSTRRVVLYRPHADQALKLIEKLVIDRNETVSSSYAVAAGYVARIASDKQILRLITFAKKLYFESEGDRETALPRRAITSGELLYAIAKHASDRFNSLASAALPFVFVAKHDPNEHVREQFQKTWEEAVGGSRAVLLHLTDIVALCQTHLPSAQWALKHTAARAVAGAVTAAASADGKVSDRTAELLWPALETALGGKTWDGKEVVLEAFVTFVQAGYDFVKPRKDLQALVTKIALREAKRQNATYRPHGIKALGQIALARPDVEMSEAVLEAVSPILTSDNESNDGDTAMADANGHQTADETASAARNAAIQAVFDCIQPRALQRNDERQDRPQNSQPSSLTKVFSTAINLAANSMISPTMPNKGTFRRVLFERLGAAFERLSPAPDDKPTSVTTSAPSPTTQPDAPLILDFDATTSTNLKNLLLDAGPGLETESARLLRAGTLKQVRMCAPLVWKALGFAAEIGQLVAQEPSVSVRGRLEGLLGT